MGHGVVITDPNEHPGSYADDVVDIADNGDGTMSLGYTSGLADTAAVYVRRA